MKTGLFTFPVHPTNKSYLKSLNEDIEAVVHADKLGFYDVFIGEHTTDEYERITSSMVFIANLINRTKKIKLATGTLNLPNGHPVNFASSMAMLDHLAKGRLIMGIGPGALISDMEAFGTLSNNRQEMFLECINHILKIWRYKPPYNIKGKHWNISTEKTYDKKLSIGSFTKPYQKPHPEIVCTSLSRNTSSIIGLTSNGWNLLSSNFLRLEALKIHAYGISKAKKVKNFKKNWRIARTIFVNNNKSLVENYVFGPNSPYRQLFKQILMKLKKYNRLEVFKKNPEDKYEKINLDKVMREIIVCGSVNQVAEKLSSLKEELKTFDTITYTGIDFKNKKYGLKSMELFANKVISKV